MMVIDPKKVLSAADALVLQRSAWSAPPSQDLMIVAVVEVMCGAINQVLTAILPPPPAEPELPALRREVEPAKAPEQ